METEARAEGGQVSCTAQPRAHLFARVCCGPDLEVATKALVDCAHVACAILGGLAHSPPHIQQRNLPKAALISVHSQYICRAIDLRRDRIQTTCA
jgi:hypothetical protein